MPLSSNGRLQLSMRMVPEYLRCLSVQDQALVTSSALDDVALRAWDAAMCSNCAATCSEFDTGRIAEVASKSLPAKLLQVLAQPVATDERQEVDRSIVAHSRLTEVIQSGLESWQDACIVDSVKGKKGKKAKKDKKDSKKKKDKKHRKDTDEDKSSSRSCSDSDGSKKEKDAKDKKEKKKKKGKKEKDKKDKDDNSSNDSSSDSDESKKETKGKEKKEKKDKKEKKKDRKDKDDDNNSNGSSSDSDESKKEKTAKDKKEKKDNKCEKEKGTKGCSDDESSDGSELVGDGNKKSKKDKDKKNKKEKKRKASSESGTGSESDRFVVANCRPKSLSAQDFPDFLRFLVAFRIYSYFETPCFKPMSRATMSTRELSDEAPELERAEAEADDFSGPSVVFLMGGPGTGKRTFGDRIAKSFGHIHLQTGGLIQKAIDGDDAKLSDSLRTDFEECRLVTSSVVVQLLLKAMRERGWDGQKYVISGFPRSLENLEAWKAAINETVRVKFFVNLECSEGIMEARQLARGLKDYSIEKIQQRFITYYHETLPIVEVCKSMGKLKRIDTEKDVDSAWKQLEQLFAPSVVFVLGGSGSGKSTLCKEISKKFRYRHLCIHELLDEEKLRLGTEYGEIISNCLRDHVQVPHTLVLQLLRNAMERHGWESGKFLLDGFPRSLEDYSLWLNELGSHAILKCCLFLECDESVLDARRQKDVEASKASTSGSRDDMLAVIDRFESDGMLKRIQAECDPLSVLEDAHRYFKPSVILVLGGPGAGKKALCNRLAEVTGYHHLNTSELLRMEQVRPGSRYGKVIEKHVDEGTVVPTEITVRILSRAMMTYGWEEGKFLISSFPRCLDHLQHEASRKHLWEKVSIRCCLFLDCSERVMEEHVQNEIGRGFDPEKQRNRIRSFQDDILPVVKKFEYDGLLRKVNAEQDTDHILMCVQEVLKWELQLHIRNHALVLIKPHACNDETMRFVKSHFATHQVSVRIEGKASTTNFDAQYSQILRYANADPHDLFVPNPGQDAFKSAFGICWAEALADYQVIGGVAALALLGKSPRELLDLCARCPVAKLAPSMQVAKVSIEGIATTFVVNGFLPHFRESFSCGMEEMHWLVVEFSTKDLSWRSFRKEVLGATDPSQAPEASIRGQFYKHWSALGLKAKPDILDNCIHASAGPLEALRERILWTNVSVYDDPLGRMLLACGVPLNTLEAWFNNPDVFGWRRGNRVISGPVFDCSEDCNTRDFCVSAVDHARTSSRGAPLVYWPVEVVAMSSMRINLKGVLRNEVASPMSNRGASKRNTGSWTQSKPLSITILHFNDVYNVEPRKKEPVGGVARFVTRVQELKKEAVERGEPEAICLFSGDAFNPSLTSTITQGRHMVEALNAIGIDAACYGNHDFDHGVESLVQMKSETNFPWLISNAHDKSTGQPLANGDITCVLDVDGRKIGLIGLIEREWLTTLHTLEPDDVDYEDFCPCARRLAKQLRKEGVEVVIALTHMRMPNDYLLAHEVKEIDIILGGHDHHYEVQQIGPHGTYVLNSGTDFRDLTAISLRFDDKQGGCKCEIVKTEHVQITASITEHPATKVFVEQCLEKVSAGMDVVIGQTAVDLDCRFSMIRTQETNIGNFVADIMRVNMKADIAILNSGTLRADAIISAGPVRMRDLMSILPMLDELCLLQLTGEQVRNVLENSVSMYPRLEGRFAQVSGVTFTFDANRPGGDRIVEGTIMVGGVPLDLIKNYKVTNLNYLRQGKDGYGVFKDAVCLADGEQAGILPTMVKDFFHDMSTLNGFETDTFAVNRAKAIMQQGHLAKVGEGPEAMQTYAINPTIEGRVECLNPAPIS